MKFKSLLIPVALFFITLTASECKKHKPGNPVDQLPPETQVGANTFGCLVDGKVFLPKGGELTRFLLVIINIFIIQVQRALYFRLQQIIRLSQAY